MSWNMKAKIVVATVLLIAASSAMAAKGKLGFGTDVSTSGSFSPVIKDVKITAVVADSPAAVAGLKPRDYIVEADGQPIDGAPASAVAGQFRSVQSGQHLRLKLRRGKTFVNVEIVAGS